MPLQQTPGAPPEANLLGISASPTVMAADAPPSSHASLNLLVTRMEKMITARKLAEDGPPDDLTGV
jgi:hypothetical protein